MGENNLWYYGVNVSECAYMARDKRSSYRSC
jgi:hypothetical protein